MKRSRRLLWLLALLISLPVAYCGLETWMYWDAYQRVVVWDEWAVALPGGGSVTYRNQSPRMRLMGPADTEKILTWVRPEGQSQDYPIESIGGGYRDLELRVRKDGKAIWLISHDWKRIVATLDLQSGRFTGGLFGTVYHWGEDGQDESAASGHPKWAQFKGGRSLGRKKFS
jgi:hypothetical protein